MTDQEISKLALKFRKAIEAARDADRFTSDFSFRKFPHGCCGDTSYLLAEYLKEHGFETVWVSTSREDWSHAWLVLKDGRVEEPTPRIVEWPEEIQTIIKGYGVKEQEPPVDITQYEEEDITGGLIIDITSDQFDDCNERVYVGCIDSFHRSFDFIQAHDYDGLSDYNGRLRRLYRIVQQYIE